MKWFVSFQKILERHSGPQTVLKSCNAQKVCILHQGRQKVKAESETGNWNERTAEEMPRCQGALPTELHGWDLPSMGETITTKKESTLFSLFRKLKHISQGHLEMQNKKNCKGGKSYGQNRVKTFLGYAKIPNAL